MKMYRVMVMALIISALAQSVSVGDFLLNLGPEEFVQADGGDIVVPGCSAPSYVDWNNDGKKDLIIGEGNDSNDGKVRIYLNDGTASDPNFSAYFYAQS